VFYTSDAEAMEDAENAASFPDGLEQQKQPEETCVFFPLLSLLLHSVLVTMPELS